MSSENKITLKPKPLCERCRSKLVHKAKFKKTDPWMALEISAMMVLVQRVIKDKNYLIKYGNDIEAINRIDCLGCFIPGVLNEIIETAKGKDLHKVQSLKDL